MALVVNRYANFRAKDMAFRAANENLANLEKDLRRSVSRQKAWKKKIVFKIIVAFFRHNVFRQQMLFRKLEQINKVILQFSTLV